MDIVYIDPGYGKGFTVTYGTNISYVENETYNPINGIAFTGNPTSSSPNNGCTIVFPTPPALLTAPNTYFVKRLSCRFSAYLDLQPNQKLGFGCGYTASNGLVTGTCVAQIGQESCSCYVSSESVTTVDGLSSIAGIHNVAFTACSVNTNKNSANNFFTNNKSIICDVDGNTFSKEQAVEISSATGFARYAQYPFSDYIYFRIPDSQTNVCYISNIIVTISIETSETAQSTSQLPLLSGETLPVRLPLGAPVTTFTAGDNGEYIGTENGQTLLQAVNASQAITQYGGNQPINHIVAYGNPSYRVGSGITQASGISESDGTITSHGTTELSTETDAAAFVA